MNSSRAVLWLPQTQCYSRRPIFLTGRVEVIDMMVLLFCCRSLLFTSFNVPLPLLPYIQSVEFLRERIPSVFSPCTARSHRCQVSCSLPAEEAIFFP